MSIAMRASVVHRAASVEARPDHDLRVDVDHRTRIEQPRPGDRATVLLGSSRSIARTPRTQPSPRRGSRAAGSARRRDRRCPPGCPHRRTCGPGRRCWVRRVGRTDGELIEDQLAAERGARCEIERTLDVQELKVDVDLRGRRVERECPDQPSAPRRGYPVESWWGRSGWRPGVPVPAASAISSHILGLSLATVPGARPRWFPCLRRTAARRRTSHPSRPRCTPAPSRTGQRSHRTQALCLRSQR